MLSYMLPVEDKSPPNNLKLNLNGDSNGSNTMTSSSITITTTSKNDDKTKIINFERKTSALKHSTDVQRPTVLVKPKQPEISVENNSTVDNNSAGAMASGSILSSSGTTEDSKKVKMTKIGNTKSAALKRVSFGSSKGSMVETLVFETPTPLPEHAEREFGFPADTAGKPSTLQSNSSNSSYLDDSGIEMQEELERSKVRVSFFQSDQPQQVSPPEPQHLDFFDTDPSLLAEYSFNESNFSEDSKMAATTALPPNYNRQISTESGWDNPFRPGGDLSREADEIVNMIKGGKPITPIDGGETIVNGTTTTQRTITTENGTTVIETVTKTESSQNQQAAPATKSPQADKKNGASNTQVSNSVVPGPQSASHVVVEEKKKKKCTCCVIQ